MTSSPSCSTASSPRPNGNAVNLRRRPSVRVDRQPCHAPADLPPARRTIMNRWVWILSLSVLIPPLAGCNHVAPPAPQAKPPEVLVGSPVVHSITDYEVFTG